MRISDLVCQGVECGGSLGGIMGANVFTTQGAPRRCPLLSKSITLCVGAQAFVFQYRTLRGTVSPPV